MNRRTVFFAILGAIACGAPTPKPIAKPTISEWTFDVDASNSPVVTITAAFRSAASTRFVLGIVPRSLEIQQNGRWIALAPKDDFAVACADLCTLRYVIDFADAPTGWGESVRTGSKGHQGIMSPSWAWLLHPEPIPFATIGVSMRGTRYLSGVRARMGSADFGEGSLAAFGELRRRTIAVPSATLELAIVGDDPIAMGDDAVSAWAERSGKTVSLLWGRFPVDRCAIFVSPVAGQGDVVFGQALSLGGPAIKAFMGTEMKSSDIPQDWVLVHEMVHLGFPTFLNEGRWLGEGVATYYEPILRSRAGHLDGKKVWSWFAEQMPRARTRGKRALEGRGDIDSVYWGGAYFLFLADVRIREETGGKKSLDDAMRAIFSKDGDATHVWRVADVLRVADEATGTKVLSTLHDEQAVRGVEVDPEAELARIGVTPKGLVDTKLVWIRDGIVK
jgi:hypothetical protein